MRFTTAACAALLALSPLVAPIARAQKADATSVPQKTPPPVAFAPEKGLTITPGKDEAIWDFGERTTKAPLEHVFMVRNASNAPLRIESLLTSCRCTTARFALPPKKSDNQAEPETDSYTLAPGKSIGIRVTIDPGIAHAVDFRKMVWLYLKGRDEAALTLTLTGRLAASPGDLGD